MFRFIASGVMIAGLTTGAALAQDFSLPPTYGSASLNSGFSNDPRTVNLSSGGSINANGLGSGCRGFIANAPDYRVSYSAGSTFPLIFSVDSDSDTTLVINGPDGRWYCDDDSGDGTNPSYRFSSPSSGQYDIWVGTYSSASLRAATLYISEVSSQ